MRTYVLINGEVTVGAVKAIPDDYPRVGAYLCVDGAADAIGFYREILGAVERVRMPAPEGRIGHAELEIGDSVVMLSDEFPDWGARAPAAYGGTPVTLAVYVEDADDVFARAVAAGAQALRSVEDQFYGDRSGQFLDPWGHRWNVATRIEDVPPDEMSRRVAEMMDG